MRKRPRPRKTAGGRGIRRPITLRSPDEVVDILILFSLCIPPPTGRDHLVALHRGRGRPSRRVPSRGRRSHEQGLIITTSVFSAGARSEAACGDTVPIALMNGGQLEALLAANEIGVARNTHDIFDIETEGDK